MKSLKQSFADFKANTPKHVQWILLFVAFVVVVILLSLLVFNGKKKEKTAPVPKAPVEVFLSMDPGEIEWLDVEPGEARNQKISITSTGDTKIVSVKLSRAIDGLSMRSTCVNIGRISERIPCTIVVDYKPSSNMPRTGAEVSIVYHAAGVPATLAKTETLPVVVSAKSYLPPPPPPLTQEEIDQILADTPSLSEPEPAPAKPEPVVLPDPAPVIDDTPVESCFEFAFAGYDNSGRQIGWIKPTRGAYKFHPFSDKNCTNPTGEYNPDTGIITELKDPSKRIGTDADHIGGRGIGAGLTIPTLSNPVAAKSVNRAMQLTAPVAAEGGSARVFFAPKPTSDFTPSTIGNATVSSKPYDRTFVLRQYKPIPATIVSEVRADPKNMTTLPVRATVDRNVYSDNGRTIVIPTGTLMLGNIVGDLPGPYKTIGRMQIEWYQFIRPDGVEFNFNPGDNPFSGDSQGRVGVPGHGSSDYLEQFVMPLLTAIVPAAVNMIAPISDKFVNQIDLDNNTVTQSGSVRSSELAKNEIITTWNKVAQKLMVDMMDNTVPPFSIAAGTRITVYSPTDLIVTCGESEGATCNVAPYGSNAPQTHNHRTPSYGVDYNDASWVGQVRSFDMNQYCNPNGTLAVPAEVIYKAGYDYRTVVAWCQSIQYSAKNNAKYDAYSQISTGPTGTKTSGNAALNNPADTKEYNEQVLGMKYDDAGNVKNPFIPEKKPAEAEMVVACEDGNAPDADGCCTGEVYTDMGDQGFNCCPSAGGDCFPPIK